MSWSEKHMNEYMLHFLGELHRVDSLNIQVFDYDPDVESVDHGQNLNMVAFVVYCFYFSQAPGV